MTVLLNLLTAANPPAAISELGGSLQLGPAAGTKPANPTLLIDFDGDRPDILLTVDPTTKLLSRIEMKIDSKSLSRSEPAGQAGSIEQFGWTSGAVATQLAKDQSFAFVSPQGFTAVDTRLGQPHEQASRQRETGQTRPGFHLDGP